MSKGRPAEPSIPAAPRAIAKGSSLADLLSDEAITCLVKLRASAK